MSPRRKTRRVAALLAASSLAIAGVTLPSSASAVNSSSCTFEKGTTTCVVIHGSHGDTSEHQGSEGSNGVSKNDPPPCKVTGSDHTC
jgi:hypothetical protein